MKRKLLFLIAVLYLALPKVVNADAGFNIIKYDIDVVVNENNTFDITERILTNFYQYKHGIYRDIPAKNVVERLDGTTTKNRAKVSNVEVSENYDFSYSGSMYNIKIGDASEYVYGDHEYVIKYTYNIGKDPIEDIDEFYFNLIGQEWLAPIEMVRFTITMPKDYDKSKLGFSAGYQGSTDSSDVRYRTVGNKIEGTVIRKLQPGEGLTVRLELPEGYFVGAGFPASPWTFLMFVVPAIGIVIALVVWSRYGKDDEVIETVEFYPPEGFNSLEIAFIYNGIADANDVTSLLIYLANKGYISIKETKKKLFIQDSFEITKLKEYDGNNPYEEEFLKGLFKAKHADLVTDESGKKVWVVKSTSLEDSFYRTTDKILRKINNKINVEQIITKSPFKKNLLLFVSIILCIFVGISIPAYDFGGLYTVTTIIGISLFYLPFYGVGIFAPIPTGFRIFWLGFTIFHSSFFFLAMDLFGAITLNLAYFIGFIICVIGAIVIALFLKNMPRRTKVGTELLGKIKGFKTFLEVAKKEEIESLVHQNPLYFYDLLPYAYVLNVTNEWIKKFENINIVKPNWYDSASSFNYRSFNSFVNNTMSTARSSFNSRPTSSSSGGGGGFSGGGSSGGGSSGGGSGGGGGGSW